MRNHNSIPTFNFHKAAWLFFTALLSWQTACSTPQSSPRLLQFTWQSDINKSQPINKLYKPHRHQSGKECRASNIIIQALKWQHRTIPKRYGNTSYDFIHAIVPDGCKQTFQALNINKLAKEHEKLIPAGTVVEFGIATFKLAGISKGCDNDGTCYIVSRLPQGLRTIRVNLRHPLQHRNRQGKTLNSILRFPKSHGGINTASSVLQGVFLPHNLLGSQSKQQLARISR